MGTITDNKDQLDRVVTTTAVLDYRKSRAQTVAGTQQANCIPVLLKEFSLIPFQRRDSSVG